MMHSTSPRNPTIILIHGFRGTHHGLSLIAKNLKGYSVIVPDIPGFGVGKQLAHYSIDDYVTWLHMFIRQQKLAQPPILLGHSFGSIICAAYAASYPQTISQLVLVNPIATLALEGHSKIASNVVLAYYRFGAWLPPNLGKRWLSAKVIIRGMSIAMAKTKNASLRRYIHRQHDTYFSRFHSPQSLNEIFTTSISHSVSEYAPRITSRTLLIAGTLDTIAPLSTQYALVKKFPNARLRVIKNVGHLTHYESPAIVARYIHDFTKLR